MSNFNCQVSESAIAFIDPQVADYQSLVAGIKPGTEVVVLDENQDAIEQITEVLAACNNIDSIHIISHGSPGCLQIGQSRFSQENLERYAQQLQQWQGAFTDSADILIYGCNVASRPCDRPIVRQGINSLFERESRLKLRSCTLLNQAPKPSILRRSNNQKPTFSRLNDIAARSQLKPTGDNFNKQYNKQSPIEDFRYETGVETPGGSEEYAIDNERAIPYGIASLHELDGFAFIQRIAKLTNTNVAASKNLTGSAKHGGDWELETRIGEIKTPLVFEPEILANYEYVLNTFGTASNFFITYSLRKVTTGDFNKDGNLDLAFATTGPSRNVSIALGNGNGTFGTATNLNTNPPSDLNTWSVAVGDFNKDGNSDLVTANNLTNNVSLLLGNGNGTFGNATYFGVGSSPYTVTAGDFNSDGNPDLVTANQGSNNISILLGNGNGNFSTATNLSVGSTPYFVLVGDFNKDNKLDFATANSGSNNVSILLQNANDTLGTATNFNVGNRPNYIALGDFNGDSNPDLATSNEGSDNVSILLGNATGSFSAATNFSVARSPLAIVAGDFNIDGKIDLATANNSSNDVSILFGNGSGNFGTATNFSVGTNPQGITVGDFNKDGLPDLATANFGSFNTSILLNATPKVNFGAATYSGTEGTTDTVVNIPVTLSSTPDADVTVAIAINSNSNATQNSDYILSGTTVTFPAGTANLTQNVAVTIKPDNIAENEETVIFNFGTIAGSIAGTIDRTTLTIPANGQIFYAIAADTSSIKEGNNGTTPLTFTATRSGDIGAASSVNYAIGGTATNDSDYNKIGGTSGANGLTGTINFAAGETSKTISLNLLGDAEVEADETIGVTLSNPVAPGISPVITAATATTAIANDDKAGINLIPLSGNTNITEGGVAGSYAVRLTSQPDAPVTISLNAGDRINSIAAITFDRNNWNFPQTVSISAIDDDIVLGVLAGTITYAISSADANYNSLTFADINISISDNDRAGISITQSAGSTEIAEGGATDTYSLVLTSEPVAPVTINFNSGTQINAIAPVTFTANNWKVPQNITVSAIDDNLSEGRHSGTIAHTISSIDANYNSLTIPNVTASIADNDPASVSISTTNTTAAEGGVNGSYSIKLNTEPIAPVTISFNPGSLIDPIAAITFDKTNWNVVQTVTVIATDDSVAGGNGTSNIFHTITSADPAYNKIAIGSVSVAIKDNEIAPTPTPTPPRPEATPTPEIISSPTPINEPQTAEIDCICRTILPPNLDRPNQVNNILYGSDRNLDRLGTSENDAFYGGINPNIFNALTGSDNVFCGINNDSVNGNEGDDFIVGTLGEDLLFGGKNSDTILGNEGADSILGNRGDDRINGREDNDAINGDRGEDWVDGGKGDDSLLGGKDSDSLTGSEGSDTLLGHLDNDTVCGGAGDDYLRGDRDNDLIDGGAGDDRIYGGVNEDTLIGCNGNDMLLGGEGDDLLNGGLGNDCLTGGNGVDRFLLSNVGNDTIADFEVDRDLLALPGGISFAQLSITQENDRALISAGNQLLVVLSGVNTDRITSRNFLTII